jgi:4-hydroxybenzoate polyprenyltransferase
MATAVRGWKSLQVYLEMIKFEHSIFALPFALIGMMWGSLASTRQPWPPGQVILWIVVAMVSCRSAAMAFNRIADRDIDRENPRTQTRAIPAGLLELRQVNFFFFASCAIFFVAAAVLGPLPMILSPVALGVTLFYSRTKRFTPLCHLVLGLSLAIAPAAAYIAVTGRLDPVLLPLVAAVMLWTAGFDILYSLQDEEFDRERGLRSMPETLGRVRALQVSRLFHIAVPLLLAWAGLLNGAGGMWFIGVVVVAGILLYEQSLVKPSDLSRVNMAFFTLNGFVSLGLLAFAIADAVTRR